jgi:hypothetical protein
MILEEMRADSGLLYVLASGEFSLESAKLTFMAMLDAVAQHQAQRVLFDGRTITGRLEGLERFLYGEFAANQTAELVRTHHFTPQFAYLLHVPIRDPNRLGEIVATNRGMKVKTFETLEEARVWLELVSLPAFVRPA